MSPSLALFSLSVSLRLFPDGPPNMLQICRRMGMCHSHGNSEPGGTGEHGEKDTFQKDHLPAAAGPELSVAQKLPLKGKPQHPMTTIPLGREKTLHAPAGGKQLLLKDKISCTPKQTCY